MLLVVSLAMVLPLAHLQGKSLPTPRYMFKFMLLAVSLVMLLPLAHPLKEDSPVSSINSTHRAAILDSRLTQDIRGSSLLSQYLLVTLHHTYWIFQSGGDQYRRKSIMHSEFCSLTLIFAEGAPPPPPTNVQNYGPEGTNNQFQYSQCTGKKKALCVCFFYLNADQSSINLFSDWNQLFRSRRRVKRVYQWRKQHAKFPLQWARTAFITPLNHLLLCPKPTMDTKKMTL